MSPTRVESSFESGSPYPDLTCVVGVPKLLGWRPNPLEYAEATVFGFPLASLASLASCGPLWSLGSEKVCGICLLLHRLGEKSGRSFEVTFEQRQVKFHHCCQERGL